MLEIMRISEDYDSELKAQYKEQKMPETKRSTNDDLSVLNSKSVFSVASIAFFSKDILKRIHGCSIGPVSNGVDVNLESSIIPLVFISTLYKKRSKEALVRL